MSLNLSKRDEQRIYEKSERERYNITKFFDQLNEKSNKFVYQPMSTRSDVKIAYDAIVLVKDKLTGNCIRWFLLEAKVRETQYDTWMLEKSKFNMLKLNKKQLVKENYLDKYMDIIYLTFAPEGTYLWDLEQLEEDGLLGDLENTKSNKCTVQGNTNKVYKKNYKLDPKDGKVYKYKYNCEDHIKTVKEEIRQKEELVTGLGTWLFNQKTNERIKNYNNK